MKRILMYAAAVAALVFGSPRATMAQPAPSLLATPSTISASYTIGAINAPAPVEITLVSTGTQFLVNGVINFTGTAGWAYLAPPSAPTASSQKINVVFSPGGVAGGLAVGTYTASIVLTGGATPVTIPLTL